MLHYVPINSYVFLILRSRRGCRDIYDKLVPVNENIQPNKWINEIGDITVDEWKKFNGDLIYIKEMKLRDFQYKLNNRILVTNTFLYKIKRKESSLCSYCNLEPESLLHLLYSCVKITQFWTELQQWLRRNANYNLNIEKKNIIFPAASQILINYIIIVAKYYIYKSKFYLKKVSIKGFENFLKQKFQNEMYISKITRTYDKFLGKWSLLYNFMINL